MDLKEAKKYLRRYDQQQIANILGYNRMTVNHVLNMKRKNQWVEEAIIKLATRRKAEVEQKIKEI